MARSLLLSLLLVTALLTSAPTSAAKKPKPTPSSPKAEDNAVKKASSAVIPVFGNVYPQGTYYVSMMIGDPPRTYFLDVDTGSDLTWLQCDAPCRHCAQGPHQWYKPKRNGLVGCKDPLCTALQASLGHNPNQCDSPNQCDYDIHYADKDSSLGVLVLDAVVIRLTNSSLVSPRIAFGCGYDQGGKLAKSPSLTDGVLGLGSGKTGIISQLRNQGISRNAFGHCLTRKGVGYLFFGDDLVPSNGMTWAPMTRISSGNYYSPGKARLFLGNQLLPLKEAQLVVFDSGSSYTYFSNQAYEALLSALKNDLDKKPLKPAVDPALTVCWKGAKPFNSLSDIKKFFSNLILNFVNGRTPVLMEIPPENYLIISNLGNACLGILNGTEIGLKNLNIIGDVSMQELMVVYDNEKQQIGWGQVKSCDRRLPMRGASLL